MMTSQNNIQHIDKYLFDELSPVDKFLFEAKLIMNPELRKEVHFQKKTYRLIKMHHRKKLKGEMEDLFQKVFNDPKNTNFQKTILEIFK